MPFRAVAGPLLSIRHGGGGGARRVGMSSGNGGGNGGGASVWAAAAEVVAMMCGLGWHKKLFHVGVRSRTYVVLSWYRI